MGRRLVSLELAAELDAVPRARRFVRDCLVGCADELTADAEVVVTELVTNAMLHAPSVDVCLRVGTLDERVRIEVEDSGRALPLAALDSSEAMTGRGLKLVAALASNWGVDSASHGRKVVWAELTRGAAGEEVVPEPEMDAAALLAAWADDPAVEERFTVRLGAVPTELLLAAKAHIDNLVREFTLATAGAAVDGGAEVPAHLAKLITTVVGGFTEARQMIKRQAVAAARRGDEETELVLTLPVSAAEAGEEYLAALDEVDRYARAARLLTLETPAAHQVFRRWYVQSLVDKLRSQAAGTTPRPTTTFPMKLAEEVSALSGLRTAARRTAGLHDVGAALAGLTIPSEVAGAVVRTGMEVLGAYAGGLAVRSGDHLEVLAAHGFGDDYLAELEGADLTTAALPGPVVFRSGEPLWIESAEERDTRFPALRSVEPGTVSTCLVPLVAGTRLGVLRFSFASPRLFDDSERRFVLALADQAALALQRSQLFVAERDARRNAEQLAHQLNMLMTVTGELAGAQTVSEITEISVLNATAQVNARSARVYLLGDDDFLRLAAAAEDDATGDDAPPLIALADPAFAGGAALSAGKSVVTQGRADATDVFVPLVVGERRLGVLSATFAGDYTDDVLSFITTLADATAQALERAIATARASLAVDRLRFLAEASAALSGNLDFDATLGTVARLVVPRLADWCVVQVLDGAELATAALAHVDPEKISWAEQTQRRYPVRVDAPTGAPNVIRTGASELYPQISDGLLTAGAIDDEHLELLRELGMTSVLVVPLTGRSGTFGAITMISADPSRTYDDSDRQFAEDLARRAAVAVDTVTAFQTQQGRLAAVTRIAQAAQQAILAPPPARSGSVALAARYVSATAEALVGGDLYEVVSRPGAVRLLIGDVRGKGLEAVRSAAIVLGEFRAAAADVDRLEDVAMQIDRRLRSYLQDEDFVTALIAEITDDGQYTIASCGHPPALLLSAGAITAIEAAPSLPLGLGADPVAVTGQLTPGDRLLLYTDGLIEAHDHDRRFVDVQVVVRPLADADLDAGLDDILHALRAITGADLSDDLALLAAEYLGPASPSPLH